MAMANDHEAMPTSPAEASATATVGPATGTAEVGGYRLALEAVPSIEGDELTLTVTKSLAAAPLLTALRVDSARPLSQRFKSATMVLPQPRRL